jgi:hypothetical protein
MLNSGRISIVRNVALRMFGKVDLCGHILAIYVDDDWIACGQMALSHGL